MKNLLRQSIQEIDNQLSKRHIDLDPGGYFIIYLEPSAGLIWVKHYSNIINEQGLAADPITGEVIPARGKVERVAEKQYSGKTAKELCVKIIEEIQPCPITMLDHAAYLGRELMRAEFALINDEEYVQD